MNKNLSDLADRLLTWFQTHGRHNLPWQIEPTPYRVWLSEIMLQQTQVATVIPYFERFTELFPTIGDLAAAKEDAVLAAWTGLGYYSRARNLHRTARRLVQAHGGQLPEDPQDLVRLPGIGQSTAGAIAALAFGRRAPILDGNVKRVLTRVYGIEAWPGTRRVEQELWQLAERHTPSTRVGPYTQAIMDLGATVCTRKRPNCAHCPLSTLCVAFSNDLTDRIPAQRPPRSLPERHSRMLVVEDRFGNLLLTKRPESGVWGGLWCFPEVTDETETRAIILRHTGLDEPISGPTPLAATRHQFTHFRLHIDLIGVQVPGGRTPQVLDTHNDCLPALDTQKAPYTDSPQDWFDPQAATTVGLAAPVLRYLASRITDEHQDHG